MPTMKKWLSTAMRISNIGVFNKVQCYNAGNKEMLEDCTAWLQRFLDNRAVLTCQ